MAESDLFEEMLAAYPAEKRELARAVYHRFADGDSTQFFSQLFLVLDVYAQYAERIPARMISANADTLATIEEMRGEVAHIAKTIETRDVNITSHAEKTDEFCRATQEKCDETIAAIELTVKNLGAQVDTKAIVQGVQDSIQSGINQKIIAPFVQHTNDLAWKVMPTLEKIQDAADEAKSEWTKRIWKTAWTTSLFWSIATAIIIASVISLELVARYDHKMAVQIADMAQVMKFNQEAFHTLAVAQIPIQVLPTQNDGFDSPPGFVLVIQGAYAADMRQVNGQNDGCIFFRSSVSQKQIRHLLPDGEKQTQTTNAPAK
ncbi:MAG TPA: hypothetical protein VMV89_05100 [Candidatus Paceibacterota bacterium]|nr:hypothetical protein [Candidatus Paceibacterota bacterium]